MFTFFSGFFSTLGAGIFETMHIEEKSLGKLWTLNSNKLQKTIYFVSNMAADKSFGNIVPVVRTSSFLTFLLEVKHQIQ